MSNGKLEASRAPVVLPYELERDIFELTTRAFPGVGPKLTLVSKYVQRWCVPGSYKTIFPHVAQMLARVEAALYETIILELPHVTTSLFMRTFDERPASFFARTVKRLHVTSMLAFEDAQRLIDACSGAVEIGAWVYPNTFQDNFLPCINTHNLRRLSMPLEALWSIKARPVVFDPALFPKLSHLEVVNPPGLYPPLQIDWDNIIALPSLTHLAFGELCFTKHKHYLPTFSRILRERPDLQVLILVSSDEWIANQVQTKGLAEDARVVLREDFISPVTTVEYWREVKLGGADMWTRAEDLVPIQREQIERTREIHKDLQDLML